MNTRKVLLNAVFMCVAVVLMYPLAQAQSSRQITDPSFAQKQTAAKQRSEDGKAPEFHTHESALEAERTLPLRIPLSPYYYVSQDINGYVDIWRNVSFIQTEYDTDSIPWVYEDLRHFVDDWTSETFYVRSEERKGLKPISRAWEVSANGYNMMHMRYDYEENDVAWKREEYYVIDPEQLDAAGGPRNHLIGVVVHYPAAHAEELEQEVLDAMNHAIIH